MLNTDTCDRQVGCVLPKKQEDGRDRPTGYLSCTLSKPEKNLDAIHRDCFAVVLAVLLLRRSLEGTMFTIKTDHHAWTWILNLADATEWRAWWPLGLTEFNFEVNHRASVKQHAAKALSRLPINRTDDYDIGDKIPVLAIQQRFHEEKSQSSCSSQDCSSTRTVCFEPQAVITTGFDDVELPTLDDFIPAQSRDAFCDEMKQLVGAPNFLFKRDKNGLFERQPPLDGCIQKLVPTSLRPTILYLAHYSILAGHPGECRMYDSLFREYYRPNMAADVRNMVPSCSYCHRVGTKFRHQCKLELFPWCRPLEFVAIDILGPLLRTRTGS